MMVTEIIRSITHVPHADCPYLNNEGIAVVCPYRQPNSTERARIERVNGYLCWVVWDSDGYLIDDTAKEFPDDVAVVIS